MFFLSRSHAASSGEFVSVFEDNNGRTSFMVFVPLLREGVRHLRQRSFWKIKRVLDLHFAHCSGFTF
ncbi:hypothetical protein LEP1GSC025_2174 [Leptospira interrogans str. 2002000621]|nr:hypothetical protein LEP1GSC025_2174 [Leptospira interrogans str. 2002000621]